MKCVFFFLCLSCGTLFAQQFHSTHHVPVNKNLPQTWKQSLWSDQKAVYRGDQLKTVGMPCGGIAAGQLYVTGDGTLANWWIANNAYNTGYGIDHLTDFETPLGPWKVCYQTFEPHQYIDQGFEVAVRTGGTSFRRELSKKDFDDISFVGEYPIAKINYSSTSKPIPLAIEGTVYSPFIPLNARESATPATVLTYKLTNRGKENMEVTLTGWLQNLVCLELANDVVGKSRNRLIAGSGMHSVVLDLVNDPSYKPAARRSSMIEDFESGSYAFWKVEGTAFGKTPVSGSAKGQQEIVKGFEGTYLVNTFSTAEEDTTIGKMTSKPFRIADNYINFKIGGGAHQKKTCMNLLVGGKIVRTATGQNTEKLSAESWDVREFKGKDAILEIIDDERGGWGHINVDQIVQSNLPATEKYYPKNHPYFGNVALTVFSDQASGDADHRGRGDAAKQNEAMASLGEKIVGSTGTTVRLKPGENKEVTFVLSWYFPNRPMDYGDGGNWTRAIPTDGPAIGNMYANWYSSALDVAGWLKQNFQRLQKETYNFHDTYYNQTNIPYWLKHRIMMPVSTLATETCQWWANDKFWAWEGVGSCVGTCTHVWNYEQALAHLFPELERNIREKTDLGTSLREDGGVLARNGWGGILIDGHAGAILKSYREHLHSKDGLFLSRNWNKIKKATDFIIREDGNSDGLIEKEQANTYDIAFYGANTYVGSLYLSALKAASKMAEYMNDSAFKKKCDAIFKSGSELSVQKLWNGEYFIQDVNLKEHPKYQYGNGCLSDQMFGQTWAHLYDLGYIYPQENVKKALQSVWKYNWASEVGIQTRKHAPERTYADFHEPGLLIATWPFDQHPGEDGVRYRDEVWTGIEYQVATNMIYEGMVEEGLSLVRSVHDRYSPEKHNPWNEIECGDHYARALASWGVLTAMQGYHYNGPEGTMEFVPVQQGPFRGFFTAAESWGNLRTSDSAGKHSAEVHVKYGKLALRKLILPAEFVGEKVTVTVNDNAIAAAVSKEKDKSVINFDEIILERGSVLSVTRHRLAK